MAEKIQIASLDIDIEAVLNSSSKLKQEIDSLKKKQKELDVSTAEGAKEFAKNDAQLKTLSKSYRDNQKFASSLIQTNKNLEKELSTQGKTTQELRDSRNRLIAISSQIKGDTEEETILRKRLNVAVDNQTEAIRDQSSEFGKGKDSIGEYSQAIEGAVGNLLGFKGGVKGATQGLIGFTKASVAFLATPIGAILGIIAGALLLVRNAMNRSEDSTNKLRRALAPVSGVLSKLLSALEPLGEFLIDGIVAGFDLATKAINRTVEGVGTALSILGFKDQAAGVIKFNDSLKESSKDAIALAEATAKLEKSQRRSRLVQLEYQKDAEKLRQIRDNENLSIKERIAANRELGGILQKQLGEELNIAKQALFVANLRIKAEGDNKDALDAQAEALTEISDIEERITGQQSEQIVNRVSLQRESTEAAREASEERINILEKETQIYLEQNGIQQDESIKARELERDRSLAILDTKISEGLIKEQDAALERLRIEGEFQQAKADIENSEAARLEEFETRKRDIKNEIELLKAEDDLMRAEIALEQEFESQIAELERLQLNEEEKTALLSLLETQRGLTLQGIRDEFSKKEIEADQKIIDEKIKAKQEELKAAEVIAKGFVTIARSIFGENKELAIAGTIIDTFFAAQRTFTALASNPIAAAVAAAAVISQGLARVESIRNTEFARGGLLQGASHKEGGIPFSVDGKSGFEAEGGESIINKRSTSMFRPLLSAINQAGGGRSFAQGGIPGLQTIQNQVIRSEMPAIDYNMLSLAVRNGYEAASPPLVSVEEINTVDSRVKVLENGAEF